MYFELSEEQPKVQDCSFAAIRTRVTAHFIILHNDSLSCSTRSLLKLGLIPYVGSITKINYLSYFSPSYLFKFF